MAGAGKCRPAKRPKNWRARLDELEGAYAPNVRAYRADFELFERWCKNSGRSPLPATSQTTASS